jgi:hypothetical protein
MTKAKAKAVKNLMAAGARAPQLASALIAALRQNTPANADYQSALAELERRSVLYDALDEYRKAIRKNVETVRALPTEEHQANGEAEADAEWQKAKGHFENIIYDVND